MDQYLTFLGSSALSEFRRKSLASKLGVRDVRARYIHYVALKGSPGGKEGDYDTSILQELLNYGDDGLEEDSHKDGTGLDTIFVYPRTGTISPWSSKGTSIAQVCGLGNEVKRIERGTVFTILPKGDGYDTGLASRLLHDRMTQAASLTAPDLEVMFAQSSPAPLQHIRIHTEGTDPRDVLRQASKTLGLALDESDVDYLVKAYAMDGPIARDPTDAELFMYAQVNSEHCRHKQFNASWTIDGVQKPYTLFDMIRNTHRKNPSYTISAYSDNAAVFEGQKGGFLAPDRHTGEWKQAIELVPYLGKVGRSPDNVSSSDFKARRRDLRRNVYLLCFVLIFEPMLSQYSIRNT